MRMRFFVPPKVALGALFALAATMTLATTTPAPRKAAAATPRVAPAAAPLPTVAIPTSLFQVPTSPKDGRNPFFPLSTMGMPQNTTTTTTKPSPGIEPSVFVLNGITSPPKPTAMINSRTFEGGEEAELKLADGKKVLVKCLEIRNDSAVILVNGQTYVLRLRSRP